MRTAATAIPANFFRCHLQISLPQADCGLGWRLTLFFMRGMGRRLRGAQDRFGADVFTFFVTVRDGAVTLRTADELSRIGGGSSENFEANQNFIPQRRECCITVV